MQTSIAVYNTDQRPGNAMNINLNTAVAGRKSV